MGTGWDDVRVIEAWGKDPQRIGVDEHRVFCGVLVKLWRMDGGVRKYEPSWRSLEAFIYLVGAVKV